MQGLGAASMIIAEALLPPATYMQRAEAYAQLIGPHMSAEAQKPGYQARASCLTKRCPNRRGIALLSAGRHRPGALNAFAAVILGVVAHGCRSEGLKATRSPHCTIEEIDEAKVRTTVEHEHAPGALTDRVDESKIPQQEDSWMDHQQQRCQ